MKASEIVANLAEKEIYHANAFVLGHVKHSSLKLGFASSPIIHLNIARNYLKELEYTYVKVKKGMYIDRMLTFSDDNLEEVTWPDNPFILIIYDKCIFSAYDENQSLWIPNREQPL
ncbi:4217_t:CDS:2 [Funneliformis geosporum]|nr:4217_t:CDS:2 [Funneliformis geosporum]